MKIKPWKHKNLNESFKSAARGIIIALKTEKNAKILSCLGLLTIIAALLLGCSTIEIAIIILLVTGIFVCEGFNSLVENTLDILRPNHDPHIKNLKDIASGVVLIASISAAMATAIILLPKLFALLFK